MLVAASIPSASAAAQGVVLDRKTRAAGIHAQNTILGSAVTDEEIHSGIHRRMSQVDVIPSPGLISSPDLIPIPVDVDGDGLPDDDDGLFDDDGDIDDDGVIDDDDGLFDDDGDIDDDGVIDDDDGLIDDDGDMDDDGVLDIDEAAIVG